MYRVILIVFVYHREKITVQSNPVECALTYERNERMPQKYRYSVGIIIQFQ